MIVVRGYALNKWLILIANKLTAILNSGFIFAGFFQALARGLEAYAT